ncbi:MAG: hypothetical protein KAS32_11240 [Candidatus Peribacteraceae bacterium]|nr:hypothetical protein [Candidatus Peribacteraceae bacterium]
MSNSENFYATINPDAVDCPYNGQECFQHDECAERCGKIIAKTIYRLKRNGCGCSTGYPTPRTIQIAAPPEHIAETDEQLRNTQALNGLPVFTVETLTEMKKRLK